MPDCLKHTQASLFADDTVIYCTGSTPLELEEKLKDNLFHIKSWLNDRKLAINKSKSQFTVIRSSQRINPFESMKLYIDEDELYKVSSYKYLVVIIGETVNWLEHIVVQYVM